VKTLPGGGIKNYGDPELPDLVPRGGDKILIIDDDPATRRVTEVLLKAEGYVRTRVAGSGEEALRLVEADKPDLILLDVMLPGMDGYTVAARFKDDSTTRAIPII
jgi:CheY-like chemotaxis protein